ncbi:YusW family protein [Alkalicoccus daliensis]|uniref:YusW-like protein n=1 Tax=Alkalicoccus daliensis TaxID=745820 RepID=A0A1H0HRH2_9BACI|nr:YusW family protein [Alkalicoccus daliensis]SDO21738.1 YusW-like protein [Alkalicoccus daliensis]
MKKFAMSIGALAVVAAGCGNDGGNNETDTGNNTNNQNEEVTEEPEANLADNEENNEGNNMNNAEDNTGLNNENNDALNDEGNMEDEEEAEAVMDQDFNNFELNVTLVDDSQWDFSYTPAEEEGEEPDATVSGDDLELEGENAVEEMEAYLSEFNVDAATDQEDITSEIADTFDFNEDDFQEYNLTIDFAEQENETEWSWSQDDENGEDNNAGNAEETNNTEDNAADDTETNDTNAGNDNLGNDNAANN